MVEEPRSALPEQQRAPALQDDQFLSRPPALHDLGVGSNLYGQPTMGSQNNGGVLSQAPAGRWEPPSRNVADLDRRELFRQMAGGSLTSPTPTSPVSLAPHGVLEPRRLG